MASHQRIASFKRPASSLKGSVAAGPHLFWEGDQLLYIGWGCSLRVGDCKPSSNNTLMHIISPASPLPCS